MCHNSPSWTEVLPLVLLGIRTAIKEDLKYTPAQLLYGTNIRLPGEFFTARKTAFSTHDNFMAKIDTFFAKIQLPNSVARHGQTSVYVDPQIKKADYVFVRTDSVKRPLQTPYEGPFKVIRKNKKTIVISRNNSHDIISIDRVKPAHLLAKNDNDDSAATKSDGQRTTSYGRTVRLPVRFGT